MSWEKLKLGEVCTLNYGKNLPSSKRGMEMSLSTVQPGKIDFHSLPYVDSGES